MEVTNVGKPLKKTRFGKLLWGIGDTLKGKTKVGKVLDGILEIVPVPNPIRIAKEVTARKNLKKLTANKIVQRVATDQGIDLGELLDDQPAWVVPVLAGVTLAGTLYLVATGTVDPQVLIELARALFGG